MIDVAIVGAGIAGLATAYELSRRGLSFVVLDGAPRAGGVILSEEIDGFTIDGGPDALLIQKPEGIGLCEELGLGGRLVPTKLPRVAYIQRGGRLHALPAASVLGIPTRAGPFVRTTLFSWPGKMRMGAELFVPRRPNDDDDRPIVWTTRAAAGALNHSRTNGLGQGGAGADTSRKKPFLEVVLVWLPFEHYDSTIVTR